MTIRNVRTLAALFTGIALALGVGSCASDSSTPLGNDGGGVVEIEITPASLEGTINNDYGGSSDGIVFRVKGSSSSDVYYWTITDDSGTQLGLPPGLTRLPDDPTIPTVMSSNSLTIKGIPTECGLYPIQIVVHNYPQHELILSQTTAIEVGGATCPAPVITSSSLVFFQDFQNERRLGVSGGTPPFTWQALSALPNQITLNSQTGTLSGMPTSSGTFPVTVRVTDSESRTDEEQLSLEIKVVTAADFTGTWSGVLTKGFLVAAGPSGPTFTNVTGQRLSLLFQTPVSNGTTQVSSMDQGTLGDTVLTGMEFSLESGPFPGLWNGSMPGLGWHLGCDPLPTGQLRCIGHSFNGPQYNAEVVLTFIDADTEDTDAPEVASSFPSNGRQNVQTLEVSVTFDEAMSGSASVTLSGGAGDVGPPAFVPNDPTTVKIPLVNVQDDTPYTLTLNPSGETGFKDAAGNALATTSISFRTGLLEPVTLSVFMQGAGSGTVSSGPPGIQCGPGNVDDCSADFSIGRIVTLTAIPDFGSEFVGWATSSCPGSGSCVVTMDVSLTVGARFEPIPSYTLTVTDNGTGGGLVASNDGGIDCGADCGHSYMRGTTVTLQAVPDSTSTFQGWDGACAGVTVASCNVTIDAAKSVTATFNASPSYALAVTLAGSGGGTVSAEVAGSQVPLNCSGTTCTGSFISGTSVLLTATPNGSSSFTSWSGACSGATCSVSMTAARNVTATFTALPGYVLTVTLAGSGGGTVSAEVAGSSIPLNCSGSTCTASLASGTSVSLTAAPNGTSSFDGWSGNCTGFSTCSVSMTAARNVTATFSALPSYTLTVTLAGSGGGSVSAEVAGSSIPLNCSGSTCTASLISGTSVSLTASPNGASSFAGWSGDCTGISLCSVSMTAARNVTATFSTLPSYTLTVNLAGTGTGTVNATVGGSPVSLNCSGSTCSTSFISGTSVTLTASPSGTSSFSGWSGDCSGATCSVSMTATRSVTVTFTALPNYVLTVNLAGTGGGTVSATVSGSAVPLPCSGTTCTGSFVSGTAVTLTATSNGTSSFAGWTGDCTGSSCTVSMTAARTVTATFIALANHLLTINRAGTGTGSFTATVGGSSVPLSCSGSTCTASFINGTPVTIVTTPAGGSSFDGWSGACTGTGPCNVTMTAPQTVTATFTASNIPIANPVTFRFSRRQPYTLISEYRYLITLTGSSPVPGPLTFKITRFPSHRDVTQWDGALPGATYTRVDPVTGALTALYVAGPTEQSVVNQTTGVITGAPIFVYVPNICHDIFSQDTFEFIVIDSAGNESLPATVTANSTLSICSH